MSHMTVAVSEETFRKLFAVLRDKITESTSGSENFGPFTASWNVGFRLEDGTVDLQNGSVAIKELDVVYDPLVLTLGVNLPEFCVGGQCIVPDLIWGGCAVRLPKICIFDDNPDVSIPINLSGIIQSEVSGEFAINVRHFVDPGRTAAMTDLDAEDAGVPNKWQFLLDPIWLDIDPLDIPDIVGNIIEEAIDNAVDAVLGPLPGWVKNAIKAAFGPLIDLIRAILDIGDDIDEWISDLLGTSIGIIDFALTVIADYFANQYPIFEFETPYPILPASSGLIPVKVPIENVAVTITTDEMAIGADVGA